MRFLGPGLLVFALATVTVASAREPQSVSARIAEVEEEYANILLDASPRELRELGLRVGTRFAFTHKGQSHSATLVEEYGDVGNGEWLGRMWEGRVEIAINSGNACTVLDCSVGDTVTIRLGGQ